MYRGELVEKFNKSVNDSRLCVNKHQMSMVLRTQKKYNVKPIGRNEYEFENKKDDIDGNV